MILTKDRLHGSEVSTQDHLSELRVVWRKSPFLSARATAHRGTDAFISEGLTSGQERRRLHLDYTLADRLYRRTQPNAANTADVMTSKRMIGPYLSASVSIRVTTSAHIPRRLHVCSTLSCFIDELP